ncbi:MAG: xanthan lyase [Bacteroidales bacterium]|nr:xanthan lyase [Bacteroidales bacterium]
MKRTIAILCALCLGAAAFGQGRIAKDFKPAADSLAVLLQRRTSVRGILQVKSVMKRGQELDFYFTQNLGDYPWREGDVKWFRKTLQDLFPSEYRSWHLGKVYSKNVDLDDLAMPALHKDGRVHDSPFRMTDPGRDRFVFEVGGQKFNKGLTGRHIALWQSHGLYYETKLRSWRWQRAKNFTTVEDMYTQSYVLPFLIPMLENAGAYVMTPRERDPQKYEVVCDNDPAFAGPREGLLRREGRYRETGRWENGGKGFADAKAVYSGNDNPFTLGTFRQGKGKVTATWEADIPQPGRYAVYVSYSTVKNSTAEARYTVRHRGGEMTFQVDQRKGGGTWIYLGTFDFGDTGSVTLSHAGGGVLTADAVRFGGGMGKIARGNDDTPMSEWEISGMPAYTEGALYAMQWAGIDTTITRRWSDDYTNDYADRGPWVCRMSGGSKMNPKEPGLGIPVDLSLAFHSDAGVTPNDSIVGTLAIYTLLCEGSRKYPNGEDRMAGREYADYVQSQITSDLRALHNPQWTRRQTWDRSYSECRTPGVPGMILEILAHQNFADMKYGLDPTFRFTVCRAVYKGMLKFLSNRYGCPYAVQPLPVNSFAVRFRDAQTARLSWKATEDPLEPTAKPTGYLLYTRLGDGAFDGGKVLKTSASGGTVWADVPIVPGQVNSYRIVAFNEGGRSFPSEVLCIGTAGHSKVLIVNNFDRVSAPAWFDTPTYAGFDSRLDGGVPYERDLTYIGEMYQFRRQLPWTDDENAGFGSSFTDEAGFQKAGNTFDYPFLHAQAMFSRGYSVCSASEKAFEADSTLRSDIFAVDLLCGKQVTTPGGATERFQVFPEALRETLRSYKRRGGRLLVSGSNIGTDIWDMVYPVAYDSTDRAAGKAFAREVLGFQWLTGYASRTGRVKPLKGSAVDVAGLAQMQYCHQPSETMYCVETPDGLNPVSGAKTFLRYADTNVSAAVCYSDGDWRSVSIGFPLETLENAEDLQEILSRILTYFKK